MAKKITIFKGAVRVLYADDVALQKDEIVPTVKDGVIQEDALFYILLHKFISIKHNTVLPTREEAMDYLTYVIENRASTIQKVLSDPNLGEEEKALFLKKLAKDSSCVYAEDTDIKPSFNVTRKEFKVLKKEAFEKGSH